MLEDVVKAMFSNETKYGTYHRRGWGFMAVGFTSAYLIHPIFSLPFYAVAGYNFVQTMRHKKELMNYASRELLQKRKKVYNNNNFL